MFPAEKEREKEESHNLEDTHAYAATHDKQ